MLISCNFNNDYIYKAVHELIRVAFPACLLINNQEVENSDYYIEIKTVLRADKLLVTGLINSSITGDITRLKKEYNIATDNARKQINRSCRRFIFQLLSQHLGKPISSYGTLTGVRPVKIVHRLREANYSHNDIKTILVNDYYLQPEKADLLIEVANNNHTHLISHKEENKLVSIYIGIPYCPSRCYYCSFPGAVLRNYASDITPYLKVLFAEIKSWGEFLKAYGIRVLTIYVGGGTPTVLNEKDLVSLLQVINDYLISDTTIEFTLEAGRADTINYRKLNIIKNGGVNRICINPQTMQDETLQLIGRQHSAQEVIKAVELARVVGFNTINLDVIIGLFAEGEAAYINTLERVLALQPENITVHTLALKKGSQMADKERHRMEAGLASVEKGVKIFYDNLTQAAYIPYYLYRQKYMRGDRENIGYALPKHLGLYNLLMMEERQTIIGLGAGAASKFHNYTDGSLTSIYNPKEPLAYLNSMENLVNRKVDKLIGLN
ncbi:MAG: coproporphyrinogen dehydrogenase HemZ [Syntrophomonadaceae bacterium]|nr:coproporphyrinogen dehydrogenase HemZ [Syntrophomonadaceae bacterium]